MGDGEIRVASLILVLELPISLSSIGADRRSDEILLTRQREMKDCNLESRANYRILLVEDEELIAVTVKDVLSSAGYDVVGVVATADDAVSLSQELRPDLVLMDVNLRGERDGVDAASEIVERLGIRSLFVSSMSCPETKARAALFLNAGFLNKPVRQQALVSAIDEIRTTT